MSSPVGHSLAGVSIYFLTRAYLLRAPFIKGGWGIWGGLRRGWKTVLFCIIIACLPDIDFFPGIFIGNINYYHHRGTHSIVFAIIVSLAVWALSRKKNGLKLGFLVLMLLLSHLAIDCISIDHLAPFGIPILWPISGKYFHFKYGFLPEVLRGASLITVFNRHNLYTVTVELIIFLPLALLSYRRAIRAIRAIKKEGS